MSQSANLLANGGCELDTTGWSPNSRGTVTRATSWASRGVASCRVTGTSGGSDVAVLSDYVPVTELGAYRGEMTIYTAAGSIASVRLEVEFWNATSKLATVLSVPPDTSDAVSVLVTAGVAPAGATRARLRLSGNSSTNAMDTSFDDVSFVAAVGPGESGLVTNGGCEINTSGWSPNSRATITRSTSWASRGEASCRVTGASNDNDVAAFSDFVPVSALSAYRAEATANIASGSIGAIHLGVEFWSGSSLLSVVESGTPSMLSVDESIPPLTDGVTVLVASGIAPAGATQARLRIRGRSSTKSMDTSFDDVTLIAAPGERESGLLLNGGCEADTAGWSANSLGTIARSTSWASRGQASCRLTGSSGGSDVTAFSGYVAVIAAMAYRGEATANIASGSINSVRLGIEFWDAANKLSTVQSFPPNQDGVAVLVTSGIAPAGATRARLRLSGNSSTKTMNTSFDDAMIEGATPGPQAPASAPPTNTSPPTITDDTDATQLLRASPGTWTGATSDFVYQWQRSTGGPFVDVPGSVGATYAITAADIGASLRVSVTAANQGGITTVPSSPVTIPSLTTPDFTSATRDAAISSPPIPQLTAAEQSTAQQVVANDPFLQQLLAGTTYTISTTGVWHAPVVGGVLPKLGAALELTLTVPLATAELEWPLVRSYSSTPPYYQTGTGRFAVAGVTALSVLVDLSTAAVVAVAADDDATITPSPLEFETDTGE